MKEIIIALKMQNNFWYPLKMVNFINIAKAILDFFSNSLYRFCRLVNGFCSVLLPI